jgi:voltage-gated sodium channel
MVAARWFQYTVVALILANAVVLGAETFESVDRDYGELLTALNDAFLGLFTLELVIRIASYGRRHRTSSRTAGTSSTS